MHPNLALSFYIIVLIRVMNIGNVSLFDEAAPGRLVLVQLEIADSPDEWHEVMYCTILVCQFETFRCLSVPLNAQAVTSKLDGLVSS